MPHTDHCEGFLVRALPYSETSRITTWLTDRAGILQILVRGARRKKQNHFDPVDLLDLAEIQFSRNSRSGLHTAREIRISKSYRPIATDYPRQLTATYCYEVIARLVETDTPLDELFDIYRKAIEYLEDHPPTPLLVERFERRIFETLGLPHKNQSIEAARQEHYGRPLKSWKPLQKELKRATEGS
jgi:DNA repair protein RecO